METSTQIGQIIGNYRITERISGGSFGSVYRAEHIHLKRRIVAIKLLHTHLESSTEQKYFTQEAHFLAQLEHPHILPLLDFGFSESQPYLITRYAPGGSLRHLLGQQKQILPLTQALSLLQQIGQALQYAHDQHIIHRDLKPENILFNERKEALLADFGIAIMLSTVNSKHIADISGTPAYMAPEQFQSVISKQSDQYALACIAYELLTGHVPFTAPGIFALGFQHLTATPVPLREHNQHIPLATETAILQALAKQRADRYPNISAFLAALCEPFVQSTIRQSTTIHLPITGTIEHSFQGRQTARETKQQWVDAGKNFLEVKRYEEALAAFEQATALDPHDAVAFNGKGDAFYLLQRYEEALAAFEQVIAFDPDNTYAYASKGDALRNLQRYEEALNAYEQAIALNPASDYVFNGKGLALRNLQRYEEALDAYDKALALDPDAAIVYANKGVALECLHRYEEALINYNQAITLDPTYAIAYINKGDVLSNFQRYEEALVAYNQAIALDPNDPAAYTGKGLALEQLQRTKRL